MIVLLFFTRLRALIILCAYRISLYTPFSTTLVRVVQGLLVQKSEVERNGRKTTTAASLLS